MKVEQEQEIELELKESMRDLGLIVDRALNGENVPNGEFGFALFVFHFGEEGYINYISNADREDMLVTLKTFIAAKEGRLMQPNGVDQ